MVSFIHSAAVAIDWLFVRKPTVLTGCPHWDMYINLCVSFRECAIVQGRCVSCTVDYISFLCSCGLCHAADWWPHPHTNKIKKNTWIRAHSHYKHKCVKSQQKHFLSYLCFPVCQFIPLTQTAKSQEKVCCSQTLDMKRRGSACSVIAVNFA